jgi:hypothetical protein
MHVITAMKKSVRFLGSAKKDLQSGKELASRSRDSTMNAIVKPNSHRSIRQRRLLVPLLTLTIWIYHLT